VGMGERRQWRDHAHHGSVDTGRRLGAPLRLRRRRLLLRGTVIDNADPPTMSAKEWALMKDVTRDVIRLKTSVQRLTVAVGGLGVAVILHVVLTH
jgi:hypothetical protein